RRFFKSLPSKMRYNSFTVKRAHPKLTDILRFLAHHISSRRDGKGRREDPLKNLAAELKKNFDLPNLTIPTVSRWVTDLLESGVLIERADYNSLWRGECHHGEQDELIRAFNLKEAIVVDAHIEHDPNETKTHYALANEAADEARKKDQYRNIRHLALGSGRTIIRYAE